MGKREDYPVRSDSPSDIFPRASRSPLRLAVEGIAEGVWLDTKTPPTRQNVKTICEMVRRIRLEDGRHYTVRQDHKKDTIWVHCIPKRDLY